MDAPPSSSPDPVRQLAAFARSHPLLGAEQELALARRAEAGDRAARTALIGANVGLVLAIARRYQNRGVPLADLVQEGVLGLIVAVDRFDWRRGTRFSTWGTIWIRGAVERGLDRGRSALVLPTAVARRTRRVAAIELRLAGTLGRFPTDAEVAAEAGLADEELAAARIADRVVMPLDELLADVVADGRPQPEEVATARAESTAIGTALAALPETERTVLELRFGTGADGEQHTLRQVGRVLGRSAERARQIEERALQRLAEHPALQAIGDGDRPGAIAA